MLLLLDVCVRDIYIVIIFVFIFRVECIFLLSVVHVCVWGRIEFGGVGGVGVIILVTILCRDFTSNEKNGIVSYSSTSCL